MTKRKTAHWLEDKSWHRIRDEMLLSPAWKAATQHGVRLAHRARPPLGQG
jgi:hypothetical protein